AIDCHAVAIVSRNDIPRSRCGSSDGVPRRPQKDPSEIWNLPASRNVSADIVAFDGITARVVGEHADFVTRNKIAGSWTPSADYIVPHKATARADLDSDPLTTDRHRS